MVGRFVASPGKKVGERMNRTEVTTSLSDLVRKKLDSTCKFWAEEVSLDSGKARVDFIGFKPFNLGQNGMCPAAIEKGIFCFFEVKSCKADFNSGKGKTFLGDENYLVCERELAVELNEQRMLPYGVKVIVPNKTRTALIVAFDLSNSFGNWSRRQKSSSELLWNMINARSSNKVNS